MSKVIFNEIGRSEKKGLNLIVKLSISWRELGAHKDQLKETVIYYLERST
jgi:hypothetical protein